MAYCIGLNCSKKQDCKKFMYNALLGEKYQILDWSTMGYGSLGGWTHLTTLEHYCGDHADNYPKFEALEVSDGEA